MLSTSHERERPVIRTAVIVATVLAAGLSGCTFTNPQVTRYSYNPSDGTYADLGSGVQADNLVVVTEAEGEPGAVVVRLVNSGGEPRRVTIAAEDLEETFTVPARETLAIGGVFEGSIPAVIDEVRTGTGLWMPMTLTVDGGQAQEVVVQVFDGTFPEYAPYLDVPELRDR